MAISINSKKHFSIWGNYYIFANLKYDLVAQPVEQLTLNQWVESSILSQVTKAQ